MQRFTVALFFLVLGLSVHQTRAQSGTNIKITMGINPSSTQTGKNKDDKCRLTSECEDGLRCDNLDKQEFVGVCVDKGKMTEKELARLKRTANMYMMPSVKQACQKMIDDKSFAKIAQMMVMDLESLKAHCQAKVTECHATSECKNGLRCSNQNEKDILGSCVEKGKMTTQELEILKKTAGLFMMDVKKFCQKMKSENSFTTVAKQSALDVESLKAYCQ